jgi:methylated-DNA-[protein]-cysteine S-methyltransferase
MEFSGGFATMTYYTYGEGPLGRMLFTADAHALTGMYFIGQKYEAQPRTDWIEEDHVPVFSDVRRQLAQYFKGELASFDLALAARGTPFQQRVWEALLEIECGETVTYGALAESIGMASSVRAVGAAVGRNPISVIIPCHRVIGADGSLTGYAGGLERKRALLVLEKACTPKRGTQNAEGKQQFSLQLER